MRCAKARGAIHGETAGHQHGAAGAKVGSVQTVLVDEVDEDGAIARSMADAPEIDGFGLY